MKNTVGNNLISQRLYSLDILRGFDMFWITGGGYLFHELAKLTNWGFLQSFSNQLEHVKWDGFALWDLIFPLFMFISGVAIPYALLQKRENGASKKSLYKKITKRLILLILLGLVYNGFLRLKLDNFRYASVLGQIGFAYFFASLIAINFSRIKSLIMWLFGILAGYTVIQLFIPVPGFGAGVLTPEGCINGYIDRILLPGRLHGGSFDPEGWLCIISATGITLMGAIAGTILRNNKIDQIKKVIILALTGIGLFILGSILKIWYPIIKSAWTTTFNLYAGGISFVLLAVFYLIADVWKYRKWGFYFKVIGLNSITIYIGTQIIDFRHTSRFLLGGLSDKLGDFGNLLSGLAYLAVIWIFLYYLYK
ncbi:acyltransferase family protein, partial [Bacteroidota bacterium]